MKILENLEPKVVFKYFEELCGIPHGSGNMGPVSEYCINFAKERNLQYYTDELKNVIILKEGTKGYENSPTMIIQGHLDMVCEKTEDCDINFLTDGLKLGIDGDNLYADGTTLGGDNGIAVAMGLALLDADDIPHPPLEIIFTADEETGLYGAEAIDVSMLKGKKFLNLDSEIEGVITVSCAGGVTAECHMHVNRSIIRGEEIMLKVSGLLGGHSGSDIHLGRANSNILMGKLLYTLNKSVTLNILKIQGGNQDNAIPKETICNIIIPPHQVAELEKFMAQKQEEIKKQFRTRDPYIEISFEKYGECEAKALDAESTHSVILSLLTLPNGIQGMSAEIEGLVETSLNLGILELKEDELFFVSGLRSAVEAEKHALCDKVEAIVNNVGGTVEFLGDYPGWEYRKDSEFRDTIAAIYEKQTGKKAVIEAIHAGLECGMFAEKIKDLDCVSIGPSMEDVHTVDERMSISSVERTWKLILEVLKESK